MKIRLSRPENKELFNHEATMARKAGYIVAGLQVLSGATALLGLRIYFSDWLDSLHPVLAYGILALLALTLVAPAEIGIRETWSYVFRSFLNRYHRGLNFFSLLLVSCLAFGLTAYSFYMSQVATRNSVKRAAPKIELHDTREVSQAYLAEVERIHQSYETQRNDINRRFDDLIEAERQYYQNQIEGNLQKIENYREKERIYGRRYTTRINNYEEQNAQLQTKKAEGVRNLTAKRNAELAALEQWKLESEQVAKEEHSQSKNSLQAENERIQAENQAFATTISSLIAGFAAWSVVLVILITGFLEVFYFKSGIRRQIMLGSNDFQTPIFIELLNYPYTYLSRHLINFVRRRYQLLPELEPHPGEEHIIDYRPQNGSPRTPSSSENRGAGQKKRAEGGRTRSTSAGKVDQPTENQPDRKRRQPPPKREAPERSPDSSSADDDTLKEFEPLYQELIKEALENQPAPGQRPQAQPERQKKKKSTANRYYRQRPRQQSQKTDLGGLFTNRSSDSTTQSTPNAPSSGDMNFTIKHVDRRTGAVEYFNLQEIDRKIQELRTQGEDAAEQFSDSGDPGDRIQMEQCQASLSYWLGRRAEVTEKMSKGY